MDEKLIKKLRDIFVKLSRVFNECYITKNGIVVNTTVDYPFVIYLNEMQMELIKEFTGEFGVLHILDIKSMKAAIKPPFTKEMLVSALSFCEKILERTRLESIGKVLDERIKLINDCSEWNKFIPENDIKGDDIVISLFKYRDYIKFKPKGGNNTKIIMTKTTLPLVSEKNYDKLQYCVTQKDENLYLIVFNFQFELFNMYMLYFYVPFNDEEEE